MSKVLWVGNRGDIPSDMLELAKEEGIEFVYSEDSLPESPLLQDEIFKVTRIPELTEMWVDPNEPVFNHHKHKLTCDKNRKKRKKRKK